MLGALAIVGAIVGVVAGILGLHQTLAFWYKRKLEREGVPATLEEFHARVPSGDRQLGFIELFLKAGLKPDRHAATGAGDTALLIAARSGQEKTVRLFLRKRNLLRWQLRKGADPERSNNRGVTPITVGVLAEHEGVCAALREAGVGAEALVGPRLLLAARRGDSKKLLTLLRTVRPTDLKTVTEDGSTALIEAAGRPGHSEAVRVLLDAGAARTSVNRYGHTALIAAAIGDAGDCASELIRDGVNLDATDNEGRSAYVIAVRSGHGSVMKLLDDAGARTTLPPDLARKYEVLDAIDGGFLDQVRSSYMDLSSRPAFDANMRLPDGRPILQGLIDARASELAKDLVETQGADPNFVSDDGTTPVQAAVGKEDAEVVRVLVLAGARTDVRTKEGDSLLATAVATESLELVDALLEGSDVNQRDRDGATALLLAVRKGNLPLVKRLLEESPNVDASDDFGATPLMAAVLDQYSPIAECLLMAGATQGAAEARLIQVAAQDDVDEVRRLLNEGTDVNVVASRERSAVLEAVRYGREAVLEELLTLDSSRAVDLERAGPRGTTPLMVAAIQGRQDLAVRLIEAGARLQAQRRDGRSALMLASERGHTDVVRPLLEAGASVDLKRRDGRTALILAVEHGHADIAELLIDHGADVDAVSRHGESPLMLAILLGNSKMVSMLKSRGAEHGMAEAELFMAARRGDTGTIGRLIHNTPVDSRVKGGKTSLLEAIDHNRLAVVKQLTAAGADVNDTGWRRTTPLLRAAGRGRLGIVQHLIKRNASANIPGPNEQTALMAACQGNHLKTAHVLIGAGANVNASDRLGRTPLAIAILEDRQNLSNALQRADATEGESDARLILAARIGNVAQVQQWLAQGANVNAFGVHRERPLVEACIRGAYDIARELLTAGADANGEGTASTTPLTAAASGASAWLIDLLVAYNADVEKVGRHHRTPLMVAAEEGREAPGPLGETTLAALLRHDANLNAPDPNGDTALIVAAAAGRLHSVNTLLAQPGMAIDASGTASRTALMASALSGHAEVVAALLNAGAKVDATDVNDSTALVLATPTLQLDVIKTLLGEDPDKPLADPNARDAFGNTPLMGALLAEEPGLSEPIVKLLGLFGAKEGAAEAELLTAAAACDLRKITQLLVERINVDARIPGEDPALVLAAWSDCDPVSREGVILALLEEGADVHLKGRWGRTALMGVVRAGNAKLVRALLAEGSTEVLEAVQDELQTLNTATTLAAAGNDPEIIELLEESGATSPSAQVLMLEHGDKYHLEGCSFVRAVADRETLVEALRRGRLPCHFCLSNQ